ncbi:MAG: TspO/MBR family protein, partial [Pseudomonadota bacterium]
MAILLFCIFLASCFAAGATGAMFPPGDWYDGLKKPSWNPPNWLFPVAWTTLYLLMSFAAARVAMSEGAGVGIGLALFALQIALNTLWTPVFFGLRRMGAALVVVALLWVAVLATMIAFWQVDTLAGVAFIPYLVW